ncbi:glycosyltransferase family protein [Paradesertivirga mongoliensis]|uniref:Glycosyltransferase family protein n=1 Tax=Paradesertivirga mongoliensis TaxID=2100740 RepID=A0ABW4ZIJ4_9SPHI|nr:glycosyltransferase family protein [Pedobacter mongoliensis]
MRILFAIQGTGNGHISRAREIVPLLKQYGELDLLVSGTQADVLLNCPLRYRFHGFSYIFGKKGSVNHWETYKTMNLRRLWRDIRSLPLSEYDLIINDFEPVTAWACKLQGRPSVALSHQASFLSKNTPRPKDTFHWQEWVFKHYAPTTHQIGFHFETYDSFINTPVIRSEIRSLETNDFGHITVYLPAYHDNLLVNFLKRIPEVRWEVFSKHSKRTYTDKNVFVQPINNQQYNKSLANSSGLLTGGGFEGPAEALYLGKKVLVMPMKYQYEQLCNAEAIKQMGVPVIYSLDDDFIPRVKSWLHCPDKVSVHFPDSTSDIVADMVEKYSA